ncbi:MAG: type I restriction endonuclease [Cyanobacteria bacterium P01_F01_bin.150]
MTQKTVINELTLAEVEQQFGLQRANEPSFFTEWQDELLPISTTEAQWLDKLKADFLSLERYSLHEELVKMAMVGPLLSIAGFFQAPFYPKAEAEVSFTIDDDGSVIRGRIDLLLTKQQFWIVVIESKNRRFSLIEAIPQALTYMMASPNHAYPTFGLVTNGTHFTFLKVSHQPSPSYATSPELSLNRTENELYSVVQTLRKFGHITQQWPKTLSA